MNGPRERRAAAARALVLGGEWVETNGGTLIRVDRVAMMRARRIVVSAIMDPVEDVRWYAEVYAEGDWRPIGPDRETQDEALDDLEPLLGSLCDRMEHGR